MVQVHTLGRMDHSTEGTSLTTGTSIMYPYTYTCSIWKEYKDDPCCDHV